MINKRLIAAVPESRKYIAGKRALCQWVSLLANIALLGAIGPAAGVPGSGPAGARESAPHPGCGRRGPGGAGCLHPAFQSHELPLRPGGKAHPTGEALPKAAGIGALLPGAGEHLRGGAGGSGGHRPAGDLFRLVPAPVLLRHAGAPDPVCRAGPLSVSRRRWCCSSACP